MEPKVLPGVQEVVEPCKVESAIGPILFGIGWGLAGLIPEAAFAGLATSVHSHWSLLAASFVGYRIPAYVQEYRDGQVQTQSTS